MQPPPHPQRTHPPALERTHLLQRDFHHRRHRLRLGARDLVGKRKIKRKRKRKIKRKRKRKIKRKIKHKRKRKIKRKRKRKISSTTQAYSLIRFEYGKLTHKLTPSVRSLLSSD